MLSWTDLNIVKMFVILERIYIIYTPTCLWLYSVNTHKHTHIHSVVFAERGYSGVVLGHAVRMCDTGVSRDAAHVHRY